MAACLNSRAHAALLCLFNLDAGVDCLFLADDDFVAAAMAVAFFSVAMVVSLMSVIVAGMGMAMRSMGVAMPFMAMLFVALLLVASEEHNAAQEGR